jgi:alpha-beta hydrolase superfamily lysophospholipase
MTATKTPVTFETRDGTRLFGILHQPEVPRDPHTAILLLSPGVKMRVAPHRLYNKMTARFVSLGYTVFRFDFHGLGDSGGLAPEALLADLYGATQVGRYVGDTVAAMDWMQRTYGTSRFIAAGLCGGALTGLLAAQRDPRIVSLLALSIPVILDGSDIDASRYMTPTQLSGTRRRYLGKLRLWDPQVWHSWKRFLTLQSHYSLVVRSLTQPVLAKLRRSAAAAPAPAPSDSRPAVERDNTNPHFAPAFMAMASSSRRMLLVFAETDRLLWDFEAKFLQRHQAALARYKERYDVHVVPRANHIFSFAEWQDDMLGRACAWLDSGVRVPAGARAS